MTHELRYYIPLNRVLFMMVISYGLYLFYWFYITWKQYRDHANDEAHPVWHALTLFVPIYNLFRTHAHMRTFKELMLNANLSGSISPGWAVLLVAVSFLLENISFQITGGFTFITLTQGIVIASTFLDIIAMILVAGLLFQVQSNLNRYWHGLPNLVVTSTRIGVGEVIFGIVGVLLWVNTFALIFSESWRMDF